MNWLPTTLVLIFSILPFAGLGHFFFRQRFFTSFILGLSLSGFIVAFMANVNASLIRPAIVIIMILGLLGGLFRVKYFRFSKSSAIIYGFILLLGLLVVYLNFPTNAFIKDGRFVYDLHYQYYANLPTEMLLADYPGRLKLIDFFSYEWTRYHFFNSAVQASLSGLLPNPGLLTYLVAQLVIVAAILLSFLENLLGHFGFNPKTAVASILWLVIGLTFFGESLTWNLATTGPLSAYAIILLVFSIYHKDYKMAFVYSIILGASAFRLLPMSLGLMIFSLIIYRSSKTASAFKLNHNLVSVLILVVLFVAYNYITLSSGMNVGPDKLSSFFTLDFKAPFDDGWSSALGFYKTYGASTIFYLKKTFFTDMNVAGQMAKVFEHSFPRYALLLMILIFIAGFLISFRSARDNIKKIVLTMALAITFIYYNATIGVQKIILLTVMYLGPLIILAVALKHRKKEEKHNIILFLVLLIAAITVYIQFCYLSLAVKAPVMLIGFDLLLWGIVGLALFKFSQKIKALAISSLIAVLMLNIYQFPVNALTRINSPRPKNTEQADKNLIDISELFQKNARSQMVNDKWCTFNFDSPKKQNLYQSILGCRLDRTANEDKTESLNARFAGKKVTDE